MKNVIIIGASGNIAKQVTEILIGNKEVHLTLFARNKNKLRNNDLSRARIVEGDVRDYHVLRDAIRGQDIVYINLSGDLETMVKNIVKATKETAVNKVILTSSIGIYASPLKPVLSPYRKAADVIESSGLDYTILRPTWFTNVNEVDYETTQKGEPEKGSVISMKSLATLITKIIETPEKYARENLGVSKPGS